MFTIQLTESQLHDIARRDKLRRLRAQEDHVNQTQIPSPVDSSLISSPTTSTINRSNQLDKQKSLDEETSIAPDLLKDHIDNEYTRRQKQVLASSSLTEFFSSVSLQSST